MKKALSIVLLLLMVLVFCAGCSTSKTPLTLEEFIEIVEAEGFEVIDTKEYYDTPLVEQAYGAINDSFTVEFIIAPTDANANQIFNQTKNNAELSKGTASSESSTSVGNSATYRLNTSGSYFSLSKIGNTILYVETDSGNKSAVDDIVKKLKY
jgi:PBP1b-binding outer membrane lipoprotein LpoB